MAKMDILGGREIKVWYDNIDEVRGYIILT
jgi:hypothetical protein